MSFFSQKQCSGRDWNFEHFFQTERLKAKLRFVSFQILCCSTLVFDREWPPFTRHHWQNNSKIICRNAVKLYNISNPGDSQIVGIEAD